MSNHKKLALLHLILAFISLSISFVMLKKAGNEGFMFIGVFWGSVNIIIAVACWFKIEFFRQVSLFISVTTFFPTVIGCIFCIFFFFPYAQWADTSQRSEKKLFYTLILLPMLGISAILFLNIMIP